jgi:hypothetical protein
MSNGAESLLPILRRYFPKGTIPAGLDAGNGDPSPLDYSFNHYRVFNGEPFSQISDDDRLAPFPIWPPDAFACAATLLEQSSAYLRLAYTGCPPADLVSTTRNEKSHRTEWPLDPGLYLSLSGDAVALPADLLKVCRVIGALWCQGAMFLSDDAKSATDPDNRIKILLSTCYASVAKAKRQLKDRYRSEFDSGDLNGIFEAAERWWDSTGKTRPRSASAVENLIASHVDTIGHAIDQDETSTVVQHLKVAAWAITFVCDVWSTLNNDTMQIWGGNSDSGIQWQRAAILLLILSDEAGKSLGFSQKEEEDGNSIPSDPNSSKDLIKENLFAGKLPGMPCRSIWLQHSKVILNKRKKFPRTLTQCFDDSICSVLPKARTPASGCTIRSLSHNLAIIPAKGRVRARWASQATAQDHRAYNLLLVPFPYLILSKDFVAEKSDAQNRTQKWGRFSYEPNWQKKDRVASRLWNFVESLLKDQPKDTINAVVFPECSMDQECFDFIAERILAEYPSIEILVAGLTTQKTLDGQKAGNFVATYMRHPPAMEKGIKPSWAVQMTRAKHHRWSLNHQQLKTYALSNSLAPDRVWWENIDIPPREMLFAEFSSGSILTTLICEDLARIEPCQAALRAVGPNLTLVLLMDSAQIIGRWPSQYAGVLTDDPGTSVLTLTSFGLINRSNLSEGLSSRAIAYWREPYVGAARVIDLPNGYHAQLVTLRRDYVREVTIDGRGDNGDSAVVWRLAGVVPIQSDLQPPGGTPEKPEL